VKPQGEVEQALTVLEARVGQRRYGEALKLAQGLFPKTEGQAKCEVLSSYARAYAGLGEVQKGFSMLNEVLSECKDYPDIQARALYEIAVSCMDDVRLRGLAMSLLEGVVLRFPNEAIAKRALCHLSDMLVAEKGRVATTRELAAIYRKVKGGDVAPSVLWTAGMLEMDARKRLQIMLLLVENYGDSGLWDDAILESARIAMRFRAYWDAVELLERLERRHETSWFLVSYETRAFEEARFMGIEARLLATGDRRGAAKAYERFSRDYERSKHARDAIMRAYELYLQSGDKKSAEKLRRKYGLEMEVER
jgi:tetratricopeptide (TPR) repeat protein